MQDRGSELFISDLHLSAHEPATVERFLKFLAGDARDAQRVTILGDLFDYWAGDDDLDDPFNQHIVAALRSLSALGVAIAFMAGNRDFLFGERFAAVAGVTLLPDPCRYDLNGLPILLTHGDCLCTDDADYQRFRASVRVPDWQAAFLARSLADRKQEIAALRARSEAEKYGKPMAIMDVNEEAVIRLMARHQARALIHGHTHLQGCHTHEVEGALCQRWVLGDWPADRGNALACSGDDWHWLDLR